MPIKQRITNIKQSENDEREYRVIKLENELSALLVRDTGTNKSSAALAAHVGSFRDPADYQGLAHFCEHMLFMGSKKYPDQGGYREYVVDNGGSTNAYTAENLTNYFFDCKAEAFYQGLDRFAQFYISPLFKDECVGKEVKAVNSEYEMNLNSDMWRNYMLVRSLSDEGTLNKKFSIGNLETLSKDGTVARLKTFHKKYYSANTMALIVHGPQELDELEAKVDEIFSPIENQNLAYANYENEPFPFKKASLKKLIKTVPVKDEEKLVIDYQLPAYYKQRHQKPYKYYSHLIGHEGEGSILNFLQKEGLATALTSYGDVKEDYFCQFTISITLTKKGIKDWKKVVEVVGAYVQMLKNEGPQEWVYQECKDIAELGFRFPVKEAGDNMCMNYAPDLLEAAQGKEDLTNFLYDRKAYAGFNEEVIKEIGEKLGLDNAFIILSSKDFEGECDKKEYYFSTPYSLQDIPGDVVTKFETPDLAKWAREGNQVHMPPKNTLIPTNFEILPEPETKDDHPARLRKTAESEVWHHQDIKFKLPKVNMGLQIYTRNTESEIWYTDPKHVMLKYLWIEVFNAFRNSTNYLAEVAECDFDVDATEPYISVSGECYSQSLGPFLNLLQDSMVKFKGFDDEQQFNNIKQKEIQAKKNQLKAFPFRRAFRMFYRLVTSHRLSISEEIAALEAITFQDFVEFNKTMFSRTRFQWLVEGNVSSEETLAIVDNFETRFKEIYAHETLGVAEVNQLRVVNIDANQKYVVEKNIIVPDEKNICYFEAYQAGQGFDKYYGYAKFIGNYLKAKYFEELRSNQQLGYATFALTRTIRGVYFLVFCIQSDVKGCDYIRIKTREFLDQTKKDLEEMTEEKFDEIRAGCVAEIVEPPKKLEVKFDDDMDEIKQHTYAFNRKEKQEKELKALTKQAILDFFNKIFFDEPRVLELFQYNLEGRDEAVKVREKRVSEEENLTYCDSDRSFKALQGLFVDKFGIIPEA